jgi:hypothetical protein
MTIEDYRRELIQDIKATQLSEEEGGTQEQIFTQMAIEILSDIGDTENARVCFDRKEDTLGRTMHKINGYALSENYETLDLFVTGYKGSDDIYTFTKQEAESSVKQAEKFFKNAVYKDYIKELEESSEVFDLAHTLAEVDEVSEFLSRVNIFVLTDGIFKSDIQFSKSISGYSVFTRIIDIEYLFNLIDKTHNPIEIDFGLYGGIIPCIKSQSDNEDYESYLGLMPGITLANIYGEFGSRLLEQNVRSFLQFTGKINRGIRNTIKTKPHMFLAYNNGIAVTAEEIKLSDLPDGGKAILWAKDFQIVNGGQTTASIYHTWKKDKAEIKDIYVQTKLTVVKKRENFNDIVNDIAEFANTQNKVSTSDLSSNKPFHIALEKISLSVWAPPKEGSTIQTRWFYERARGQYKNARLREGFTNARRKAFDFKTPSGQVITKEALAKYINSYQEVLQGKKLVVGPHIVIRGGQKNYIQFLNYNMNSDPYNIYFEDLVAKAILFKSAEKIYGVNPGAIGDMRYITVPCAIAWLGFKTDYKLDLYRIWKSQVLSESLKTLLYGLMISIESFIKETAPAALYGEWAKKEECWIEIRNQSFSVDFSLIKDDLLKNSSQKRKSVSEDEIIQLEIQAEIDRIKSVPPEIWHKIEKWGNATNELTPYLGNIAFNMSSKVRSKSIISEIERNKAIQIINLVIDKAPDLLYEIDEIEEAPKTENEDEIEVTIELIRKIVEWDRKNKKLQDHHFRFMWNVLSGKHPLNVAAKRYAIINLKHIQRFGFKIE